MIQKGDDLINGGNHNQFNSYINSNHGHSVNVSGNLIQSMSFEDYLPRETTLPPVETVLPLYIPTPPPSLPSPSVNTTAMINASQFQLQHHTNTTTPQHNQNINIYKEQQQQVAFHSSHSHNMHNHNNIQSTNGTQLFVDYNYSTYEGKDICKKDHEATQMTANSQITQSQETLPNLSLSDASTVDADETGNLNEPYTYLQILNSDNLMHFSQQSVIQQLMDEQMDVKPNLNLIPTCEEHDHGGYNFNIQVNSTETASGRPGVIFSKASQRLYIKTNENVYIDCFYTQKMPIQPLRVRVFAVFDKDTSDPVLRCQNHISKDTDPNEQIRRSLVRCENPNASYCGSDTGKSINDRYSVVVPLNATVKVADTNQLKQQLIISFTCYNSCMNRKKTAAIFLLEGMNGEILAQRILPVKISTCPKRDRRLCEEAVGNFNKRKHLDEPDFCPSEPKISKYEDSYTKDDYSRSSCDETASDDGVTSTIAGSVRHENETGDFVLTLKYKSRKQMLQTVGAIYSNAITNEILYKPSLNGRKTLDSDFIKKLYENTLKLKVRNNPAATTPTQ